MEKEKDLLEKGILTTLGFWLLIHEKADEVIKDLIEKGKVAPEEGKQSLADLSKRVDDEKEEIKKKINGATTRTLKEAGCVTKKDIEELTLKLEELKGRVTVLERKKNAG